MREEEKEKRDKEKRNTHTHVSCDDAALSLDRSQLKGKTLARSFLQVCQEGPNGIREKERERKRKLQRENAGRRRKTVVCGLNGSSFVAWVYPHTYTHMVERKGR